jgi:competence protein ComEC
MDDMSTSGTAHFIAISGLNLAIIAAFGYFMLRMMMIPYRAQRALLIVGIILYSVMVGLSPPVFRAMVMIVLMLLAQLLGRRGETLNILALAAIVIAAVRPDDVMSVGYQLSFIAVFCLVVFTNPIVQFLRTLPARVAYRFSSDRHEIGFPQYLHIRTLVLGASSWRRRMAAGLWEGAALGVATTVAAWVGTFPLVLFHFGKFSIWTAAANLVMLPVMNLWMLIGFLVLIATLIQSAFGWAFLLVPAFIGHARAIAMIEWPAHFFSSLPMSFKNIPRVPIAAILVLYSAIASLLLWKRLQWTRYMTAGVLGVAVFAALWPVALQAKEGPFELTVLDVGHGGATFIRFPDGRTVLYDCGSYKQSDVARHVILPFLRERGVTHLDAVIISHPHLDHFDGLASLLENYRVGMLVLTDYFTPGVNTYWAPVWQAIQESGVSVVRMHDGGTLEGFPELSFILAHVSLPDKDLPEYTPMLNETSLVVRVECGGGSALLTGDIERQGIEWFNARYDGPPVDVIVAPHHGDYEKKLTTAMLQKLRPRAVIIPADRPSPRKELQSAVRRLSKGRASEHAPDARLYTTRANGAIIVRIEGGQIYIKETLERHDE